MKLRETQIIKETQIALYQQCDPILFYNDVTALTTLVSTSKKASKVVSIPSASTVDKSLALPIRTIMEEPQKESLAGTC